MRSVRAIIAATLLLTTAGVADADNILVNPGFENGDIAPWDHWWFAGDEEPIPPEQMWAVANWEAHSGQYCTMGWGSNVVFRQEIEPTRRADITEFSCWVKQDYPEEGEMRLMIDVQFDDPDDGLPGIGHLTSIILDSNEWTFYDGLEDLQNAGEFAEGILGDGTRLVSVGIMGTFDTMTFTDDWTLVPEPTSLALLGIGGLAILRRRRA